jgi:fido (protein-threonine AMPylation protein)
LRLFKGQRARAQRRFERRFGVDAGVAALGAIALHPFVRGAPRPGNDGFLKLVRMDSYRFAFDLRRVKSGDELLALARATVQPWARAAEDLEEEHYRHEFFAALDAAGRAEETALDIFGPAI